MKIYVVIPARNENATIKQVVGDVARCVKNIIVVDDCSFDGTPAILGKLNVTTIHNQQQLGYVKSLEAGINTAFNDGADYVVTYDADGQHKICDLKNFIKIIEDSKPGIIIGRRNFTNRFMEDAIGKISYWRFGLKDPLCGLKAYRRDIYEKYGCLERRFTVGMEIVFRARRDHVLIKEIAICVNKRHGTAQFGNRFKANTLEFFALFNLLPLIIS